MNKYIQAALPANSSLEVGSKTVYKGSTQVEFSGGRFRNLINRLHPTLTSLEVGS